MFELTAAYKSRQNRRTGEEYPASWSVVANGEVALLWGFGRQRDAEIARDFMLQCGIDWTGNSDEIERDWNAAGGREALMKQAVERLQW